MRGACAGQLVCSVWTARPHAAPKRGAHAPGTGEGVGHIRGVRSGYNVTALLNIQFYRASGFHGIGGYA